MFAYKLTYLILRFWVAGMIAFGVWGLSSFIFASNHSFKNLRGRLWMALIWPLALCSREGRSKLFNITRYL